MEGDQTEVTETNENEFASSGPTLVSGSKTRKRLTNREIMSANDTETRDVDVPEWNGFITLKGLTSKDRDAYELDMKRDKNGDLKNKNVRASLVARMAVDEHGNRQFSDEDAAWLGRKNAAVMDRLYLICTEMNGMTKKDQEEIEGN